MMRLLKSAIVFSGVQIKCLWSFLDTAEEWHSFVVGFCEVMCPWAPRLKYPKKELKYIKGEWHYYLLGRSMGMLLWLGTVIFFRKVVI